MLLSARMLNLVDVNNYTVVDSVQFTQGDTVSVYFQLIDTAKNAAIYGSNTSGLRYVPASGATLTVTIENIDTAKAITDRACTQPFVGDASIWMVSITAFDTIEGIMQMRLKLTQSAVVTYGLKKQALSVTSTSDF